MRIKLEAITYHKLGLNDKIDNKSKFYKTTNKKIRNKKRTEV
jgi:hypothetical protein